MPDKPSSDHSGHRQRLRNRFLAVGLNGLSDEQALELLLTYAIPRRNLTPLVRELLERFGSYYDVLQASPEQLRAVKGIGDSGVAMIMLVCQSMKAFSSNRRTPTRKPAGLMDRYRQHLKPLYEGRFEEAAFLAGLDANGQIIHTQFLGSGGIGSVEISLRHVVSVAIGMEVEAVFVAHNHPSGLLIPSDSDISATILLQNALNSVDIALIDHYILTDSDIISIRDYILDNL